MVSWRTRGCATVCCKFRGVFCQELDKLDDIWLSYDKYNMGDIFWDTVCNINYVFRMGVRLPHTQHPREPALVWAVQFGCVIGHDLNVANNNLSVFIIIGPKKVKPGLFGIWGFSLVRCIIFAIFAHLRSFLRATAATAIARLSHRNSVRLSVRLSVCHTGGSGKNGAS